MRENGGFHISSTYEHLINGQTPLPPSRRHARYDEGMVMKLINFHNYFRRRMKSWVNLIGKIFTYLTPLGANLTPLGATMVLP